MSDFPISSKRKEDLNYLGGNREWHYVMIIFNNFIVHVNSFIQQLLIMQYVLGEALRAWNAETEYDLVFEPNDFIDW
jgi:hypothetical protein